MWKPDEVVSQHRTRAVALWTLLVTGIITYTAWLIYSAVVKRENPSTAYTISNTVYAYPDTLVCLYDIFGCDNQDLEEECVATMNMTEGGQTRAVFFPGGEYEQEIAVTGGKTASTGWCVEFETSAIKTFEGQERDASRSLDYILLDMYWHPGGKNGTSTTCVPDGHEWEPHSQWLYMYLHDPVKDITSTGIQTPYSCVTNTSNSHAFTTLGIGLTVDDKLEGGETTSYKALVSSTAPYKNAVNSSIVTPYAYLALEIMQAPDSLKKIVEIDPLDLAEIFGNVGGFWDLILILWPIFFVAVKREDPNFKSRNFKKSIAKGAERVVEVTGRVVLPKRMRRGEKVTRREGEDPTVGTWTLSGESPPPAYNSRPYSVSQAPPPPTETGVPRPGPC